MKLLKTRPTKSKFRHWSRGATDRVTTSWPKPWKKKSLIGFVTAVFIFCCDAIPGDSNLTHLPTSTVNRARKKRREMNAREKSSKSKSIQYLMFVAYFFWRNNDWVVLTGRDFLLKLFALFWCNRLRCAGWRAAAARRAQIEELGQFRSCITIELWFKRELTLTAETRQDVKVMRQSFYARDAGLLICIPMAHYEGGLETRAA